MKSKVRRSLIIGVIGAGALLIGFSLGSFTTAGVNSFGQPSNMMAQLQAFSRQRDADEAARAARTADRAGPAPIHDAGGAHFCEGCDAGASRYVVTNAAANPADDEAAPADDDEAQR